MLGHMVCTCFRNAGIFLLLFLSLSLPSLCFFSFPPSYCLLSPLLSFFFLTVYLPLLFLSLLSFYSFLPSSLSISFPHFLLSFSFPFPLSSFHFSFPPSPSFFPPHLPLLSLSAKDEDFDSAGGLLGSSMKRVKNMAKAGHNRWMCYMILFIVAVFFVCYYIIKWRSN